MANMAAAASTKAETMSSPGIKKYSLSDFIAVVMCCDHTTLFMSHDALHPIKDGALTINPT
jgi:hypothetical protein